MSSWCQRGVGFSVIPAARAFPHGPGLALQRTVAMPPGLVPETQGKVLQPCGSVGSLQNTEEGSPESHVQSTMAWPASVDTLPSLPHCTGSGCACPRARVL